MALHYNTRKICDFVRFQQQKDEHIRQIPHIILYFSTQYHCHMLFLIQGIEAMFLTPKNINVRSLIVPMNINFLVHRFGEFTMLFFGEAVNEYCIPVITGILSDMVLQVFKFENEPHGDCEGHCLWRGLKALLVYNLLTQALCVGLICFAITFKTGLTHVEAFQKEEDGICRMLSGGESRVTMYAINVLYSIRVRVRGEYS